MSLRKATLTGISWVGSAQVIKQVFQFTISVFLARLLSPHEFGLLAMVTVFTSFAGVFSDFGLGLAIVQKLNIEERHINAVFWINVMIGFGLTVIFICLAPLFAHFYHEPLLLSLTFVIAFYFIVSALSVVQKSLLQRKMNFKALSIADLSSTFISGIVAIYMAKTGCGVWSLIGQLYTQVIINTTIIWFNSSWRPSFSIKLKPVKELFNFSLNLLGFNVINYWSRNLDSMLIGKFIGSAQLGIYARAYQLMLLPLTQIVFILTQVMVPALSTIQKDIGKMRTIYKDSIQAIAFVTFPLMLGLFVVSTSFIIVIYGDKWRGAIPILQILCFVGMVQSIVSPIGWIYNSLGRTDIQFKWGILSSILYFVSFIIGLHWGIIGVAVAYCIANIIILYPTLAIALRLIDLRPTSIFKSIFGILVCSIIMAISTFCIDYFLFQSIPIVIKLATDIVFSILIYYTISKLFKIPILIKIEYIVKNRVDKFVKGISNVSEGNPKL